MSFHEVQDLLDDLCAEDDAAKARAVAKKDWCPTCGYSESEHTLEGTALCLERYYANELALMKALRG